MNIVIAKNQKQIADNFLVRGKVFVVEQQIDYEIEFDGLDGKCILFTVYLDEKPVGAARLLGNKVGRVSTLKQYRNQGVASHLMRYIEAYALSVGLTELMLHAQLSVKEFYSKLGYITQGTVFQEAQIDHIKMIKTL